MKLTRKSVAAALVLAMGLTVFSGCERNVTSNPAATVVAKYGNEKIYLDEAYFYAHLTQYQYEKMYNMASFWKTELTTGYTYEDSAKGDTMSKILQTRVLCEQADALGVSLSVGETAKIDAAVAEFMKSEEGAAVAASEDLVKTIYTQNALANKVREAMIADTDKKVDESEYVCRDMDCIVIYENEKDAEGDDILTEEEVSKEVFEAMNKGDKVDDIYKKYDEDIYNLYKFNDYAVCKKDEYPFSEKLFALEKRDDVDSYYDAENKRYYVFRLNALTDEEATKDAIAEEIASRETKNFQEKYKAIKEKAKTFKVEDAVWDAVNFDKPLYVAPATTAADEKETESAEETTKAE